MTNTGIYKITSPTGFVYIGQSRQITKRKKQHFGSTTRPTSRILDKSLKKHGADLHNFEIIYDLPIDAEDKILDTYEILFISQYKECGLRLMNLTSGGSRCSFSDNSRKKMSESQRGKKKPPRSAEHRRRISIANMGNKSSVGSIRKGSGMTGKHHSLETKNKLMVNHKNANYATFFKKGNQIGLGNKSRLGQKLSEETKAKMRGKRKPYGPRKKQ